MQFGLSGSTDVALMAAFWLLFYGVLAVAGVRLFGWLVDRRTAELRDRVALLEHEVAELESELEAPGSDSDDEG